MSSLDSSFTSEDLNLLFEAITEWENRGSEMLIWINAMKNMPDDTLPDDMPEEVKENVKKLRKYYLSKEKDFKSTHQLKAERSTLLKAKIIMQKTDAAINSL